MKEFFIISKNVSLNFNKQLWQVSTSVTVILVCAICGDENSMWFQNLMINYHYYSNTQYSIIYANICIHSL